MALSGLEQRHLPLVHSLPFWKPWGPGRATPGTYPDDEDETAPEPSVQQTAQKVIRSWSWGGFTTYAQAVHLAAVMGGDVWTKSSTTVDRGSSLGSPKKERCHSSTDDTSTDNNTDDNSAQASAAVPSGQKSKRWSDFRPTPIEAVKPVVISSQSSTTQAFFANTTIPRKRKKRGKASDGSASPTSTASHSGSHSPDSERGGRSQASGRRSGQTSQSPGSGRSTGSRSPVASGPITTLMLRNLPHSLTQAELLEEVDKNGYDGLYDFCYLPHKFAKHKNLGFAFLNFISTEDAAKFRREWHLSRRFGTALNVSAAAVQGREQNEKKAASQKMSRVRNPNYRPTVFTSQGRGEDSEGSPLSPLDTWSVLSA